MEESTIDAGQETLAQKFKPVIFPEAEDRTHRPNVLQQQLLFEAMQTTQSPEKLKEMIGAKNVAEVYRVFDVMVNQKDFQKSLHTNGVTFDRIAKRLSDLIDHADKDADSLKAIQLVMQSQGVDKFVPDQSGSANWQDLLMETVERNKRTVEGEIAEEESVEMYSVKQPELPAALRKQDALEGAHGAAMSKNVVDEVLRKIYE